MLPSQSIPSFHTATVAAFALAAVTPVLWAANFSLGRLLPGVVDPLSLNFLRWAIVTALLAPLLVRDRRAVTETLKRHGAGLVLVAGCGIAGFNTALYAGLARVPAADAAILFGATPLIILALAALQDRRLPPRRMRLGAAIALIGLALACAGTRPWQTDPRGFALVLVAAALWAGYSVGLARIAMPLRPMTALALQAAIGTALMVPFLPFAAPLPALGRPDALAAVLYLALGASLFAYWTWQRGVRTLGARRAGPVLNLLPVLGTASGVLLLGEHAGPGTLAGVALLVMGVGLAQTGAPAIPKSPTAERRSSVAAGHGVSRAPAAPRDPEGLPRPRAWPRGSAADRRGGTSAGRAGPAPPSSRPSAG